MNPRQDNSHNQPQDNAKPQPVAYDNQGRPLYHHPPTNFPPIQNPIQHESGVQSRGGVEELNLSKGEVLLREVHRHPIVMIGIYVSGIATLLLIIVIAISLISFTGNPPEGFLTEEAFPAIPSTAVILEAFGLGLLSIIFTLISLRINAGNRFYVTTESVVQRLQNSIFHVQNQQINLLNIEDVTYEKHGLFQHMFNYGTVRMSTEGDETTYLFKFTPDPKTVADHVLNAQEAHTAMMHDRMLRH